MNVKCSTESIYCVTGLISLTLSTVKDDLCSGRFLGEIFDKYIYS